MQASRSRACDRSSLEPPHAGDGPRDASTSNASDSAPSRDDSTSSTASPASSGWRWSSRARKGRRASSVDPRRSSTACQYAALLTCSSRSKSVARSGQRVREAPTGARAARDASRSRAPASTPRRHRSRRSAPVSRPRQGGSTRCRARRARRGRPRATSGARRRGAARPLDHVRSSTRSSSSGGATTSTRMLRTTQRCSGAPHPVSSTSSLATSWR